MKNFILLIVILFFQVNAFSQSDILKEYLVIKDALVASKQADASKGAQNLIKSIKTTDANSLSPEAKKLFTDKKSSLLKLTEAISASNDIEKQRSKFAELSALLWPIVKESASETLFYDYCPMKQMYWISAEEPIKNPYYGSKMLTCGSVSEKSNK